MRDETSARIDAMTAEERVLVLEYFAASDPEGFDHAAREAHARYVRAGGYRRGDQPMTTPAFPPYSGEDVTCPKCGNQGAATTYRAYGHCLHPERDDVWGAEPNERLCRRCRRCDYGWDEATTDTTPPNEETP